MRVAGCPKKKMAAKYDKAKSGTSHGGYLIEKQ